ncbi:hypothetical protein ACFQZZ_18470 [Nocardia sp. GCM10030253]|uniref:hypothetical protein n=1 Tax=Nocardia sp. GCM10030253 TaxID=3273404 RepID=UPI00363872CF
MADDLHGRGGVDRDIYAATGDVLTAVPDGNVSIVGVEVDPALGDAADSLREVHRAPRGAPAERGESG